MFDPKAHLIHLPRKVKDQQTGQWSTRHDEYLEVKWRLCWFREQYPHGTIDTQFLRLDWEQRIAICQCTVSDGEGGQSTATGTETRKGFEDFVEKSETRSVGRALALLGFGTQFVGEERSEGEHIVDAPVTTTATAAPDTAHETPGMSPPLPVGEEGTRGTATNGQSTALEHPTDGHLAALRNLAITECQEPVDVYEDRIRTTMKIPKQASVAPKLLTRTMSMTQYMEVFAYYRRLEAQLAKGKDGSRGNASKEAAVSESTAAPTGEAPTVVPSPAESSSAPGPDLDTVERDRQRLRTEVAAWDLRVTQTEIKHVIQHNPYTRAPQLLWQARTKAAAVTPIEAAAD
jgi:hypothetical protein